MKTDNRHIIIYTIIAIAMLCLTAMPYSSAAQPRVTNLSVTQGLSNDFVNDMAVDSDGFVWVATRNGLNRITAYGIMAYNTRNSSILNNFINAVCYDPTTNSIWAATQGGVSIVDCRTSKIKNITSADGMAENSIINVTKCNDGGMWIVCQSNGVQHYDTRRNQFSPEYAWLTKATARRSHDCYDDAHGHLYVCHNYDGMTVADIKRHTAKTYRHNPADPTSLPNNNVRAIVCDSKLNVWVGTSMGLATFNPTTGRFQRATTQNGYAQVGTNIYGMQIVGNKNLLVASNLDGVSTIDLSRTHPERIPNVSRLKYGSTALHMARSVVSDSYGNLWVGSYGMGVDYIDNRTMPFSTIDAGKTANGQPRQVYGVAARRAGGLWAGCNSELLMIENGKVTRNWNFANILRQPSAFVYIIHEDRSGNVWLGLDDEGVAIFNPKTQQFKLLEMSNGNIDIHAFLETNDGRMIIGSELGAFVYGNGRLQKADFINRAIASPTIYGLIYDRQGKLWVGTDGGGVSVFAPDGRLITSLNKVKGLPSNSVTQLFVDYKGQLWIATMNGLCRVKDTRQPEKVDVYGADNGLNDVCVMSVAQDNEGAVWIGTYSRLAILNETNGKFFDSTPNWGATPGGYVEGSVTLANDGCLYFGSPKGVCRINTKQLYSKPQLPKVSIVKCESTQGGSGMRTLSTLLPDDDGVYTVSYDANTVRTDFCVSDYGQRGLVEYMYRMEGLDDKWYAVGNETTVTFRNLSPGRYVLHIKARLVQSDIDSQQEATITIHVTPPWWATWWMYIIYTLIVIGTGYVVMRAYKRRLQLENSLKLRDASLEMERINRQREHEMNDSRLKFYTNIAHELRTPLTLIIGPIDDLRQETRMPQLFRGKLNLIHQNALQLLRLINRLMEFRQTETGNRTLTISHGSMSKLISAIGTRYAELNRNKDVQILTDIDASCPDMYFDSDTITHIVDNLMSNALKYTPRGSVRLALHTQRSEGHTKAVISVTDTGYGIAEDALPHIFERYYQAKGKHQASGTGIGLALVKSLAELHEASITVKSKEQEGTTFTLTLDADNTYPDALHRDNENDGIQNTTPIPNEHDTTIADGNHIRQEIDNDSDNPILLVVEDNDSIRQYISNELDDTYQILAATNGVEALRLAEDKVPDIVVSDIMMPEMDGIELCTRLKNDVRTSHIPVILLTAKDTIDDKEEGYRCGADSYMTKPFSAKLLRARVDNLLEQRRRLAHTVTEWQKAQQMGDTTTASADSQDDATTKPVEPKLLPADQRFIDQFTAIVTENISDTDMNVQYFTDRLNMSYSTFYRKVKQLLGITPNEYVRKLRLARSAKQLASGEYNVTEAAMMNGFDNMGYFRKCFREEFGMAPSEYMKSAAAQ